MNDKLKFFAQYLGCKIAFIDGNGRIHPRELTPAMLLDAQGDFDGVYFLPLRPLESITDEEAIKVGKLIGDAPIMASMIIWGINIENKLELACKYTPIDVQIIIDYLRSRSFALPYMGYSVEQLQEMNWIKLIEK